MSSQLKIMLRWQEMLSAVSSVISGAGAELGAGWSWHHDDHRNQCCWVVVHVQDPCTGGVPVQVSCTLPVVPHPVPGTPRPGEHWHMSPVVTSGHGPILPVWLDTVCSMLQRRLCEPAQGPVSVLRSASQRKVKSEYKLKHMLWNPALEILSGLHRRPFLEFSKQLKQNKTQNFWNFLCPEFNCACNLSSFHSEFLQTLDLESQMVQCVHTLEATIVKWYLQSLSRLQLIHLYCSC